MATLPNSEKGEEESEREDDGGRGEKGRKGGRKHFSKGTRKHCNWPGPGKKDDYGKTTSKFKANLTASNKRGGVRTDGKEESEGTPVLAKKERRATSTGTSRNLP